MFNIFKKHMSKSLQMSAKLLLTKMFFCTIIVVSIACSQALQISGQIITVDSLPLPGIIVSVKNQSVRDTTDTAGAFHLVSSTVPIIAQPHHGQSGLPCVNFSRSEMDISAKGTRQALVDIFSTSGRFIVRFSTNGQEKQSVHIGGIVSSGHYLYEYNNGVDHITGSFQIVDGSVFSRETMQSSLSREHTTQQSGQLTATIDSLLFTVDGAHYGGVPITTYQSGALGKLIAKPTDIVLYYPFSGNAHDASGWGYNGTVTGAALTSDRFNRSGRAYSFNGNTDFVDMTCTPTVIDSYLVYTIFQGETLDVSMKYVLDTTKYKNLDVKNADFSVAMWVKKFAVSGTDTYGWANAWGVSKWSTASTPEANEWCLALISPPGKNNRPCFYIQTADSLYIADSPDSLSLNQWHFVVGVRSNTTIKVYVDGVLKKQNNIPDTAAIVSHNRSIKIAASDLEQFYTNAAFDDIMVVNHALSEKEINVLFHIGNY